MRDLFNRHKFICLLVWITLSGLSACNKGPDFHEATIIGPDLTLCADCCGGLLIKIEGSTPPNNNQYFHIKNKPSEFGFDNNTTYPVYGKVVWTADESKCGGLFVDIAAWIKR